VRGIVWLVVGLGREGVWPASRIAGTDAMSASAMTNLVQRIGPPLLSIGENQPDDSVRGRTRTTISRRPPACRQAQTAADPGVARIIVYADTRSS
jgi:hypothetical protein